MLNLETVPTEELEGLYTLSIKEERWDDADLIHNTMFERNHKVTVESSPYSSYDPRVWDRQTDYPEMGECSGPGYNTK